MGGGVCGEWGGGGGAHPHNAKETPLSFGQAGRHSRRSGLRLTKLPYV